MFAKTARVLHFDIDPAEINKNIKTDAAVIGDLKVTLARFLEKLPKKMSTEWNGEIERLSAGIADGKNPAGISGELRSGNGSSGKMSRRSGKGLHPRFIIEKTAEKAGDDAIIVTDVGQHQIWAAQYYPAARPRSFLSSGGLGTMGFGLGAAEGAKLANPKRPVILFSGDGGFQMNSAELATLKQYGIPILIVIFNNHSLGMIRQWQNLFFAGKYSESDLGEQPDFVKLAEAYGLTGYRAQDEDSFTTALEKARRDIRAGQSAIIDALIDKDEKVLPMVPSGKPIHEQIL
jgi:acetolactate synthase-1/2/3 large subunit